MDELRELYQEAIVDHSASPRNFGALAGATHEAEGYNPMCGDHYRVYVQLAGDRIEAVRFEGEGCAISKASGSMMSGAVRGKTRQEVQALFEGFRGIVTGQSAAHDPSLGKLLAFAGVSEFPMRVKCATLAWHTLLAALAGQPEATSTES